MSFVNRELGSELEFEFELQLLPFFTKFTKNHVARAGEKPHMKYLG